MEKRLKRIELLLFFVTIVTVANLFSSSFKGWFDSEDEPNEVVEKREAPSDLTKDVLDKIVYDVKTEYNRDDWQKLYGIYNEYAKAQLDPKDIESEFKKLKSICGKIGTYAYSHYIFEGDGSDAEWFEFHYKCRFDNGNGTIKISTRTADDVSGVVGINITLDEI